MQHLILSQNEYAMLYFFLGLGWGLWLVTLISAIIIDNIKWNKWVCGK